MKSIINFYTAIAVKFYGWRWLLVAMFFSLFPLLSLTKEPALVLSVFAVWISSQFILFVVLSYGPIRHFQGSAAWQSWRSMAWLFLTLFGGCIVFLLVSTVAKVVVGS